MILNKLKKYSACCDNPIFNALFSLNEFFSDTKNKSFIVDSKYILQPIRKTNELFNNDYHHDAHEFLTWIINYLHETYVTLEKNGKLETGLSSSPFKNIFMGYQVSQTKCLTCESNSSRKERFLHIALDIENNVSLTSCLKKYIRKELMKNKEKVYCENCNNHLEAERKYVLYIILYLFIINLLII